MYSVLDENRSIWMYSVLDENRVGHIQSWMRTGLDVFRTCRFGCIQCWIRTGLDVFSVG